MSNGAPACFRKIGDGARLSKRRAPSVVPQRSLRGPSEELRRMLRACSGNVPRTLRGRSEEMHNCFMLAFLGLCDPLRTFRGSPHSGLIGVSSLSDRAHTRAESARSSTVMNASDAHADLSTRPHTSHMVACDVSDPRASPHPAHPPEEHHAVILASSPRTATSALSQPARPRERAHSGLRLLCRVRRGARVVDIEATM